MVPSSQPALSRLWGGSVFEDLSPRTSCNDPAARLASIPKAPAVINCAAPWRRSVSWWWFWVLRVSMGSLRFRVTDDSFDRSKLDGYSLPLPGGIGGSKCRPGSSVSRSQAGGQMRNSNVPTNPSGPIPSEADPPKGIHGAPRTTDPTNRGFERRSVARLPPRVEGPWLCVPSLRLVCRCRVAVGAGQDT